MSVVARLRALRPRYHDLHPFHQRMNAGDLSRDELRRWAANRYYYQAMIPRKDAAILSNCDDLMVRRRWAQRLRDHDGDISGGGGLESWHRLAAAVGVAEETLGTHELVLPGVRYAVDAYLHFCQSRPWLEAVASSLTELFGPDAIQQRVSALERHYPWLEPSALEYFRERLTIAPADADYALKLVVARCVTPAQQDRAVEALSFKCDVLWAQLDAIAAGETRPVMQS